MFRGRGADAPTVDTAAKVAALAQLVESIAGGGRPT
jgi:hypothetical protein